MAAKTKRSRATLVKQSAVKDAEAFLKALPEKTKEDLSLKEAVNKLKEPLQAALAKGYSYQELAAQLENQGIHISATTLKNYLPSGKRGGKGQASTTTRKRAAKQLQSAASATSAVSLDSPKGSPEEPVSSGSSTKQRGKGKTNTGTTRGSKAATEEPTASPTSESASRSRSSAAKPRTSAKQTTKSAVSQRTSASRSRSSKTAKK